jgi:hypothetical protein
VVETGKMTSSEFSSASESTASEDSSSNEVGDESSDHSETKQDSLTVAAALSWLALRSDLLAAVTVTVT